MLPLDAFDLAGLRFQTAEEARPALEAACAQNPDLAQFHELGLSGGGRPVYGVTLGHGPRTVTLVAGTHADEPVGPETLRRFVVEALANRDWLAEGGGMEDVFERFTFRVIPHVNPDAEAANRVWIEAWPDLATFLRDREREKPGRDVEFGYPAMRAENRLATGFLFAEPVALHVSLHGMAFSEGALLLVERHWAAAHPEAFERLRAGFRAAAAEAGLRLHDHDRGGDKGFFYFGPGFTSTPEGAAMRRHFLALGEGDAAARFHASSMEQARVASPGRTPLCLVTELPLFVIEQEHARAPGVPAAYLAFQEQLPAVQQRLRTGSADDLLAPFQLRPLDLETAVRLQLRCLDLGLTSLV